MSSSGPIEDKRPEGFSPPPKKKYKNIIPLASSDSESSDNEDVTVVRRRKVPIKLIDNYASEDEGNENANEGPNDESVFPEPEDSQKNKEEN